MANKVFISYASLDQTEATKLVGEIERRGIPCWISNRDIAPGADYQQSIVAAVQSAGAFLLLFTENANRSVEIPRELALAGKYRKTVVPARMQDILPTGAFEYPLTSAQYIDLFRDFDVNLAALCQRLAELSQLDAATRSRVDAAARRAAATARLRRVATTARRWATGVAAAAVALAVLVGGVWVWRHLAMPAAGMSAGTSAGTSGGTAAGGEAAPAGPVASVPMPAGGGAAIAALPPGPAPAPAVLSADAGGATSPVPPTPVEDADLDRAFRAQVTAAAAGGPYATGTYGTVDGTRYALDGPCVSLPGRTTWSLRRLAATPAQTPFTAVWTTGPAAGHPDLANTKATALPAGYDYGVADDNGRRGLIRLQQIGGALTIAEYGDPNDPPTTPSQKLTLARVP